MATGTYDFQAGLRIYYKRELFPFKPMFQWISYGGNEEYIGRREWSFTFDNDIYLRFQSYTAEKEWKSSLIEKNPIKIDIGPVYSLPPKNRANYDSEVFLPVERELIFDIDMDEYNSVRTCCTGTNICRLCWAFITVAIKVINSVIKEDFGFKHVLWVYSGRRGVHCWICDEEARKLSAQGMSDAVRNIRNNSFPCTDSTTIDSQAVLGDCANQRIYILHILARGAIVDYLSIIAGEGQSKKVNLPYPLHPALRRAYEEICLPLFEQRILPEQMLLESPDRFEAMLSQLPANVADALRDEWHRNIRTSVERWEQLKRTVDSTWKDQKGAAFSVKPYVAITLAFSYPRLDVAVSKGLNHLLKSPFCVHPKTGRICVPIDPENCEFFDPDEVPTVTNLIDDLNSSISTGVNSQGEGEEDRMGYNLTRLAPHVAFFRESFLLPLLKDVRLSVQKKKAKEASSMDF